MTFAPPSTSGRLRASVAFAAMFLALATVVTIPVLDPDAATTEAATGRPLAVIVVGPSDERTSMYLRDARRIAAQLGSYGARVRQVSSPSAPWTRVSEAARGANLFIYLGSGLGYPSPYGTFDPLRMNGLGLNASGGHGHANVRYYGESYVRRSLRLAPGAVVILNHVPYAAGSSEPGRADPRRQTAVERADNYAAGFLGAGAAVVFASDRPVSTIIRDLFRTQFPMTSVFWGSPWTSSRYDASFASARTRGSTGILAPSGPDRYDEAVVGRLSSTATDWRRTWNPTVTVRSIPALLSALANDAITEIVVANGTYRVSGAAYQRADSLWIGARFAGRTRPVLVRAETTGGVTFDGGGAGYFGGMQFVEGAHDQTWQGFVFAHGTPTQTGVISFGGAGTGYVGMAGPHHITLRDITIAGSIRTDSTGSGDHSVYFSQAVGGPHDILIDGLRVDGSGGLDTAITFYHSDAQDRNAWNVTVRRLVVNGTRQAIELWDPTLQNIVIEDSTITDAELCAVRYEYGDVTLRRVTSTNSGQHGFCSSRGSNPPGVTFIDNDFR